MTLRLLFFAALRDDVGVSERSVSVPSCGTVEELLRHLGRDHPALLRPEVRVAVNEEFVTAEHPLVDGDEVAFIPPVAGG